MAKDLNMNLLLDIYGELLTEKQREMLELYYADDLSLGEISSENGITRQGVYRSIRTAEEKLNALEKCVGAAQRLHDINCAADKIAARLDQIGVADPVVNELLINIKERL